MDATGWALVITAIFAGLTGLIGSIFAGYVAIRQLPAIHTLVNSRAARQDAMILELRSRVDEMAAAALEKSDTALIKSEAAVAALQPTTGDHP